MSEIAAAAKQAFGMVMSLDSQVFSIVVLSLQVTMVSVLVSTLIGVPLGFLIGLNDFSFKRVIVVITHTLMGIPPVIAGLGVYLLLTRSGPLGRLQLLFTPLAMVIAQVVLVVPIITGLTMDIISHQGRAVWQTAYTLGARRIFMLTTLFREHKIPLLSTVVAGYGRAISEVGAVMLVGGNIQGHTRVMTTAIVLETGKGNFDTAIAIGLILLLLSLIINTILYICKGD